MNKAIFLDRDGVINEVLSEKVRFVNKPADFHLLPGVAQAIAILRRLGYQIFVVTNQGGVGCGFMSEKSLLAIHKKMKQELLKENKQAIIDDIRFCPHKPTAGCRCRKPQAGMILELAKKYRVNPKLSYMVGDREVDIEAGRKAGCMTIFIGQDYQSLLHFAEELQEQKADQKKTP